MELGANKTETDDSSCCCCCCWSSWTHHQPMYTVSQTSLPISELRRDSCMRRLTDRQTDRPLARLPCASCSHSSHCGSSSSYCTAASFPSSVHSTINFAPPQSPAPKNGANRTGRLCNSGVRGVFRNVVRGKLRSGCTFSRKKQLR